MRKMTTEEQQEEQEEQRQPPPPTQEVATDGHGVVEVEPQETTY